MVTGVIGSVHAPVTQAQSAHRLTHAARTYTFAKLGLSLQYPSTWTVKTNIKTADAFTKATRVAKFNPTATVVYATDGVAFVEIITRNGAVSAQQFEQAVVAVFTDGATIRGKVAYQDGDNMVTINHQDYDRADAVVGDPHGSSTVAATMLATQAGKTTVFFIGVTILKKSNTAARMKERDSVLTSLTFG
jgi:hypothetical protein